MQLSLRTNIKVHTYVYMSNVSLQQVDDHGSLDIKH